MEWWYDGGLDARKKFVKIIQSFHDGMQGHIIDKGELSELFGISNGTKEGCVLAALLFSIFFFHCC